MCTRGNFSTLHPGARRLWNLMEKPQSSLAAKLVSLASILLVLLSTLGMCLNTLPSMQVYPA